MLTAGEGTKKVYFHLGNSSQESSIPLSKQSLAENLRSAVRLFPLPNKNEQLTTRGEEKNQGGTEHSVLQSAEPQAKNRHLTEGNRGIVLGPECNQTLSVCVTVRK